jgi:hypothetical protein
MFQAPRPSTASLPTVRSRVPPPLFELVDIPVGKHRHAGSSLKSAAVPHSFPLPRRILHDVLPHLMPPLPVCRSPRRVRAEQGRHTPSAAAPLVVYDLPVPSTLLRVGAAPRRATYFSSAVGRAALPPCDTAPLCRRAVRVPGLCTRATLHAGPLPRSGSGPPALCRPPRRSCGPGWQRPYVAGPCAEPAHVALFFSNS